MRYNINMLKSILGNSVKERILLYLLTHKEVHLREISSAFKGHHTSYLNQLKIMEKGGVLTSRLKGRTRLYVFNPRYPFLTELKALLEKAIKFMPKKEKEKYYTPRLRPRRAGKPL